MVGSIVLVSGLKKLSRMMFVTAENSMLHIPKLISNFPPKENTTIEGKGEMGLFLGVVSGIYMQGIVVDLDEEVFLLMTNGLLTQFPGLGIDTLVSEKTPVCNTVPQWQSLFGKFIISMEFSPRLWVLLVISCFPKKFSGILSENDILGSKHVAPIYLLQLTDANGSIDVVILDLPSTWNFESMIEAVELLNAIVETRQAGAIIFLTFHGEAYISTGGFEDQQEESLELHSTSDCSRCVSYKRCKTAHRQHCTSSFPFDVPCLGLSFGDSSYLQSKVGHSNPNSEVSLQSELIVQDSTASCSITISDITLQISADVATLLEVKISRTAVSGCMLSEGNMSTMHGIVVAVHEIDCTSPDAHFGTENRKKWLAGFVRIFYALGKEAAPTRFGPGVSATFHRILALRPDEFMLMPMSFIVINSIKEVNAQCKEGSLCLPFSSHRNTVASQATFPSCLISDLFWILECCVYHLLVLERNDTRADILQLTVCSRRPAISILVAVFILDMALYALYSLLHQKPPESDFDNACGTHDLTLFSLDKILKKHGRVMVKSYGSILDSLGQDLFLCYRRHLGFKCHWPFGETSFTNADDRASVQLDGIMPGHWDLLRLASKCRFRRICLGGKSHLDCLLDYFLLGFYGEKLISKDDTSGFYFTSDGFDHGIRLLVVTANVCGCF
ncbi:CST complex subunit CTC1, plant [Dillenia turbinata]|uniref:CST complex subunit CTC1 n=1 Tax=Dillenia turbinata TaxID=194707 RepID=A0AAN8ZFA5_9MAGN